MQKHFLPILVLLTGLLLSGVAAYYSIIGLTAIFAGSFWPVVIMGSVLEIGKLVAVSWIYNFWEKTPFLLKSYLMTAIVVLMLITSMGIFGFLSRAHIEQQVTLNTGVYDQIQILDSKIKIHDDNIKDIDIQIVQINDALTKLTERGQAQTSIRLGDQQRKTRDSLILKKQNEVKLQSEIRLEKIKLESEFKKIEAEVGPIKYVAELIYGSSDNKVVDKAIRIVIMLLIFVFDPLAVLLLLAFNISLKDFKREEEEYKLNFFEIKNKDMRKDIPSLNLSNLDNTKKKKRKRMKIMVKSGSLPIEEK